MPQASGQRWLVIVGVLVAAVLAAGGAFLLLGGDDDDAPVASSPDASSPDTGPTTASVSGGQTAPVTVATVAPVTIPLPSIGLPPVLPGPLPPGQPPGDLGDDAAFNSLAQACFGGDMQSCDTLYIQSDLDSEYSTYADTCAGRQPANTGKLCIDAFQSVSPTTAG